MQNEGTEQFQNWCLEYDPMICQSNLAMKMQRIYIENDKVSRGVFIIA